MTTPPNDTIEQLANELGRIVLVESLYCDKENYDGMKNALAKYVSRMIIENRIDELLRIYGGSAESNLEGQHNRIAELRKTLKELQ